jgi:hypothetical protein
MCFAGPCAFVMASSQRLTFFRQVSPETPRSQTEFGGPVPKLSIKVYLGAGERSVSPIL